MKNVSAGDFEKIISEDKKAWILDVREDFEFKEGHLLNAFLVPTSNFQEKFKKLKINKEDKVLIYCRSGYRSLNIAEFLEKEGYGKIYNLSGGIIDWLTQGKELTK